MDAKRKYQARACIAPDCGRKHYGRGLCWTHYSRTFKGQDVGAPVRGKPAEPQARVTFRLPATLKALVDQAAEKAGLDPSEWWRKLAADKLKGSA